MVHMTYKIMTTCRLRFLRCYGPSYSASCCGGGRMASGGYAYHSDRVSDLRQP